MNVITEIRSAAEAQDGAISGALVFVCSRTPAAEGGERLSRLLKTQPGLQLFVIELKGSRFPWPELCSRRLALPLDERHWETACEIGMQLCLNEGHSLAGALRSLEETELSRAIYCLKMLAAEATDAIIAVGSGHDRDAIFVSSRAAFACAFWGGMAATLGDIRQDALAVVFSTVGRRLAVIRPHETKMQPLQSSASAVARLTRNAQEFMRIAGGRIGTFAPPRSPPVRRVAVITPYYKEPDAELERCLASVREQSHACDHFMVSDGFPNPLVQRSSAIHIELGAGHSDNGNTPRYAGGLVALALGYDALAYLDADNWFERHHIKRLVEIQHRTFANAVCSQRNIFLPDGHKLHGMDPEDVAKLHVDTSCYLLTRDCEFVTHLWGQMPQSWGPVCDRVVFSALRGQRLEWTPNRTLNFKSNYAIHFRRAGKPLPKKVHGVPDQLWRSFARPPAEFAAELIDRTARMFTIINPYKRSRGPSA